MSGKKPATRERHHPHDEEGSSDAPFPAPPRSSPLHLEVSQPHGGDAVRRESPPGGVDVQQNSGRMHLSPIHAPLYPDSQHHQQAFGQGGHQPPTRHVATTVTPDSRGLLPHELMSPPLSAPRRRSGGSVSTLSVSPSKRTRIGKFIVFVCSKYFTRCFRSEPTEDFRPPYPFIRFIFIMVYTRLRRIIADDVALLK
jgi:hypothetical protein